MFLSDILLTLLLSAGADSGRKLKAAVELGPAAEYLDNTLNGVKQEVPH